jgi:glycosyltransferase involved in cell wall biosynthesis
MLFSLIVATIGRHEEIDRLLHSLACQTCKDFEIIFVDQNDHDKILEITRNYDAILDITVVKSAPGLSRARNVGIRHASGNYIGFPDDDCWYPCDLLDTIKNALEKEEVDALLFRACNAEFIDIARFSRQPGYSTPLTVPKQASSISMFVKRPTLIRLSGFDENMGLGSGTQWPAAEDYDLPIRLIRAGGAVFYTPDIIVHHDLPQNKGTESMLARAIASRADGYLWRKHSFPLWYVAYHLLRPIGGCLLALVRLNPSRARFHLVVAIQRFRGWRDKPAQP